MLLFQTLIVLMDILITHTIHYSYFNADYRFKRVPKQVYRYIIYTCNVPFRQSFIFSTIPIVRISTTKYIYVTNYKHVYCCYVLWVLYNMRKDNKSNMSVVGAKSVPINVYIHSHVYFIKWNSNSNHTEPVIKRMGVI